MRPRGLLVMMRWGGVVFRVGARCCHVSSDLRCLSLHRRRKEDFSPSDSGAGTLGNYSGGENPDFGVTQ